MASGDTIAIDLLGHAEATPASSDALRSGVYYFAHGNHARAMYTGTHQVTRSIELNWALESSSCVTPAECGNSFRSMLGPGTGVLFTSIAPTSKNIVVHFGFMPAWLSACTTTMSAAYCNADAMCAYRDGIFNYQLYGPRDPVAWRGIVHETVDALLDLLVAHPSVENVYIEAVNEPNVRQCSWNDTQDALFEHYRTTSRMFSEEKTALCAARSLPASRCARLKFGGLAAGGWDGKIDQTRPESLTEDLIANVVAEARVDPRVVLDFVSFHGFFRSVPSPAEELAAARDAYTSAYTTAVGSEPAPFPMPELVVTEWNAGDADRAGPRHPAILAEGFWGFLASGIDIATIASLDYQDDQATLASNDFGLLLPDTVTTSWQRPAYFVYSMMRGFADLHPQIATATTDQVRLIISEPRQVDATQCFDLVMWDFAPDPFPFALTALVDPGRCDPEELARSYATATPAGALPAPCAELAARGAGPALQALCEDVVNGRCDRIPTPTPPGGHACDATWAGYFAEVGAIYDESVRRQGAPTTVTLRDVDPAAAPTGASVSEDHADPSPKPLALAPGGDGRSLTFSVPRNAVVGIRDVCVR